MQGLGGDSLAEKCCLSEDMRRERSPWSPGGQSPGRRAPGRCKGPEAARSLSAGEVRGPVQGVRRALG